MLRNSLSRESAFSLDPAIIKMLKNIEVIIPKRTIILPISTRSCGFIIRTLVSKLQRLNALNDLDYYPLTNALYRITLLQIDYKLEEGLKLQKFGNVMNESYDDTYLKEYERRALYLMGAGFAPLVNYISAIGFVEKGGKPFLPRHPKLKIGTCCPYYIRNSNLRSIVEYLSSEESDNDLKRKFMLNSPIPGAQWEMQTTNDGKQDIVSLMNPNDICPANYSVEDLCNDITTVTAAIDRVSRKYPYYISTKGINWSSQGMITQTVSTQGANVYCPSYPLQGQIPSIIGEHGSFWTPEKITNPEAYMGIVHMLGEAERESLLNPICCSYRSEVCGAFRMNFDYITAVSSLMNSLARY